MANARTIHVSLLAGFVACAALSGCERRGPAAPALDPTVAAVWNRIREANAAWLEPNPGSITLRVDHFGFDSFAAAQEPDKAPWRLRAELELTAVDGRNARLVRRYHAGNQVTVDETRYAHGVGGALTRMPLPPDRRSRKLRSPTWLATRVGVPLWTSLHVAAEHGLLPGTTVSEQDDGILLRMDVPLPPLPHDIMLQRNQWAAFDGPVYGVEATGLPQVSTVNVTAIEWELAPDTLRPRRLVEHALFDTIVEFGEDWLTCGAGMAPRQIVVKQNQDNNHRIEIAYEMQCHGDAWVVRSAVARQWRGEKEMESLAERIELREMERTPVDATWFDLPDDVELPRHSHTVLKPGERVVCVTTSDGLTLEGKLSLPANASGPVPVVMFLPGSGPWTFERLVQLPPQITKGDAVTINYLDLYISELHARGLGFFCMGKRGCAQVEEPPFMLVRRAIFGKVTPAVLLDDYAAGLAALRSQAGVNGDQIVLMGISEGTVMAPRLALRAPDGIAGMVLAGYAEDNTRDTIVWQTTVGPWRNVARVFDLDDDGRITSAEWEQGKPDTLLRMRLGWSVFGQMDANKDGVLEPADLKTVNALRLTATLKAVEDGDDDWLWWNLLKLSTAHLRSDWDRPPLHEELLRLSVPIHIVHGTHDGSVRVEGARAAQAAFRAAGRSNLVVHIIDRGDHDQGYGAYLDSYFARSPQVPAGFAAMFNAAAQIAGTKR